jgi:hypothetical protein
MGWDLGTNTKNNTNLESSYRRYEYFSVAAGRLHKGEKKFDIFINSGAIRHFSGRAEHVAHGLDGLITPGGEDTSRYSSLVLNRSDSGIKNELVEIPESNYDEDLLVGNGDKLYLKYEGVVEPLGDPFLKLPIVNDGPVLEEDYRNIGSMKIKNLIFNDFSPKYSIEPEYIDSFETSEFGTSFNFLIAEFSVNDDTLIKNQKHSGIIFMPRIFRLQRSLD